MTQFFSAANRQQLVGTGSAVKLEGLFDRYDYDGTGMLNYKWFADALLGVVANPEATPGVRAALKVARAAMAAENGGLKLLQVRRALSALASARGADLVPRREAQRVLLGEVPRLAAWDLREVLAEACRPHAQGGSGGNSAEGSLKVSELLIMLRGALPRARRAAVNAAWAVLDPHRLGRAPHAAVAAGLGPAAAAFLPGGAHGAGVAAVVHEAAFVELYKDISACVATDEEFESSLRHSFPAPIANRRVAAAAVVAAAGTPVAAAAAGLRRGPVAADAAAPVAPSAAVRAAAAPAATASALASAQAAEAAARAALEAAQAARATAQEATAQAHGSAPPARASASAADDELASAASRAGAPAARPVSAGAGPSADGMGAGVGAGARAAPLPGSVLAVFRDVAAGRLPVPYEGAGAESSVVGSCIGQTLLRAVPYTGKEWFLGNNTRVISMPTAPVAFGAGHPSATRVGASLVRGVITELEPPSEALVGSARAAAAATGLAPERAHLLVATAGGRAALNYLESKGRKGQPMFRFGKTTSIFGPE